MKLPCVTASIAAVIALAGGLAEAQPTHSWGTPQPGAFEYLDPNLTPLSGASAPPTGLTCVQPACPVSPLASDTEFYAIAETMSLDVDRVYEYVRNTVRTTPQFGLSKGGYGAMVDGAGTPFDQADLMIRLIRSWGGTANFVYGDIEVTGQEFADWFGPSSSQGACELLAAGGIPAQINGSTSAACSSFSLTAGSLTSVRMRHAWVSVDISGTTYHFDPSFKFLDRPGRADAVFNAAPTGAALRTAAGGTQGASGATGVTQLTGHSPSSIRSTLSGAVGSVRTALINAEATTEATQHAGTVDVVTARRTRHIVGGGDIVPVRITRFANKVRDTALANAVGGTTTYTELPNELRTWVHIRFRAAGQSGALVDYTADASAFAGRNVMMMTDNALGADIASSVFLELRVDGEVVDSGGYSSAGLNLTGLGVSVDVAIDHPYYGGSNGAGQADAEYTFGTTNAFPAMIMLGLGERGDRAELRNTAMNSGSGLFGWQETFPCQGNPCEFPDPGAYQKNGKVNSIVAAGENWLTNASRMLDIYEGVAQGRRINNHVIGLSGVTVDFVPNTGQLGGQQLYLNVAGSLGFGRNDANANNHEAFAFASGSALAALEQAILKGQTDAPSVNGTPSMFEWFLNSNTNLARAYAPVALPNSALQIRMLLINSGNETAADTLLWNGEYPSGPLSVTTPFSDYTGEGYTVIAPQSMRLGPVRNAQRETDVQGGADEWSDCTGTGCTIDDFDGDYVWRERGLGFVAFEIEGRHRRIAPIANARQKGGGAGNFPENIETPTATQEALDEAYETWATAFSVDDRTGGLTLTPPADMVIGAGDFPYSLGFQRTYSSDRGATGPMGWGWSHNHQAVLNISTDVGATLGDKTPHSAISTFIAASTLLDLFETGGPSSRNRDVITAQLALNWWADTAFENVVNISRGTSTERFMRQPDDAWIGEIGSAATLVKTGTTELRVGLAPFPDCPTGPQGCTTTLNPRTVSEGHWRQGLSFTHTSASGVVETFTYGVDAASTMATPEDSVQPNQPVVASASSFLRRSTVFPYGMTVTYGYTAGDRGTEYLTSISNNAPFNRTLTLSYETNPLGNSDFSPEADVPIDGVRGPQRRLRSVSDGTRTVTFGYSTTATAYTPYAATLNTVTDVMNQVTSYGYTDTIETATAIAGITPSRMRISSITMPHDPANAFMTFGYDDGRTRTVTNANSNTWIFYNMGGVRGRHREPDNHASHTMYDEYGLPAITEDGHVMQVESRFDGAGRTIFQYHGRGTVANNNSYGTRQTFYDANGNAVIERQGSRNDALGNLITTDVLETVTEFDYPQFPNLPTRAIDGEGNAIRYCYHSGQTGCSAAQAAGHDGLLRAEYGAIMELTRYWYDGYGRTIQVVADVASGQSRETDYLYWAATGLPYRAIQRDYSRTQEAITQFHWGARGDLIKVVDPEGRTSTASYRLDRRVDNSVTADQDADVASLTRYRYDNSHRLIHVDQAATVTGTPGNYAGSDWITTSVTYTPAGKVDTITQPADPGASTGDVAKYEYYTDERVYRSTVGFGTPEAIATEFLYQGNGDLYCVKNAAGTSDVRAVRRYYRGPFEDYSRYFTGNHVQGGSHNCFPDTSYVSVVLYDAFYRNRGHRFDDNTQIYGILDNAGNMIQSRSRANQFAYHTFDASNRLDNETWVEGTQDFTYNRMGERTQAVWQSSGFPTSGYRVTTDIDYDWAGRVLSETRSHEQTSPVVQTLTHTTSFEYDLSGKRTAIIWPDGYAARYRYDGAGRIDLVCEDADGSTTTGNAGGVTGCNTILAAYSYDRLGRRTELWLDAGTGITPASPSSSISYSYEDDGDLVALDHSFAGATDVRFTHDYDATGRLTATAADQNGWLWTATAGAFTRSYETDFTAGAANDLDQLTGYSNSGSLSGAVSFTHDTNGNRSAQLSGGTTQIAYVHDSRNRLLSIGGYITGGGFNPTVGGTWNSWEMAYDTDGRRISMTSPLSTDLSFVHSGDMEIADVDNTTGRILRRYVPGPGVDYYVAMIVTSATCNPTCGVFSREFYHTDRMGHVIAMASDTGAILAKYIYTPFGVEEPWNTSGQPFRYTGQRRDGETGLYYFRARYYDPASGRFLQTDPVLYQDQMNLYAYVGNNPLMFSDPSGEWMHMALGAAAGAVAGVVGEVIEVATGGEASVGGFLGAAAGGATTGAMMAGCMGTCAVAASAAGAAVDSVSRQVTDGLIANEGDLVAAVGAVDVGEVGVETLGGAALGGLSNLPGADRVGDAIVDAVGMGGRGGVDHVGRTQMTQLTNNPNRNISGSTMGKIVASNTVRSLDGSAASAVTGALGEQATSRMPEATLSSSLSCAMAAQECSGISTPGP